MLNPYWVGFWKPNIFLKKKNHATRSQDMWIVILAMITIITVWLLSCLLNAQFSHVHGEKVTQSDGSGHL